MDSHSDYEVRFQNRTFMKVREGRIEIDGADYGRDMDSIKRLIGLLSEVLVSAATLPQPAACGANVIRLDDFRRTAFSAGRPACR